MGNMVGRRLSESSLRRKVERKLSSTTSLVGLARDNPTMKRYGGRRLSESYLRFLSGFETAHCSFP
jgi:hypothetical protein